MRWAWAYLAALAVSCALSQEAPSGVPAAEAWRDLGKTEAVCGQVVDSWWPNARPQAPTYLCLERPRPEQTFTVIIPFAKRDAWGDSPEKSFRGKRICVTGKVEADSTASAADRKHRVQVVVEEEEQIVVE